MLYRVRNNEKNGAISQLMQNGSVFKNIGFESGAGMAEEDEPGEEYYQGVAGEDEPGPFPVAHEEAHGHRRSGQCHHLPAAPTVDDGSGCYGAECGTYTVAHKHHESLSESFHIVGRHLLNVEVAGYGDEVEC